MKLVKGAGGPGKGACWMSAIHWYTRADKDGFQWSDHPECVDPVIRSLCIRLNDMCTDKERGELIGPHLFRPVGTLVSKELTIDRAMRCADKAIRVYAVLALRKAKLNKEADTLEALPLTNKKTAKSNQAAAAYATATATAAANAATAAADAAANAAANAAAYAAYAANAAYAAYAANAAYAAANAADAAANTATKKQELLSLIIELCDMGTTEIRCSLTQSQVVEFIEGGCRVDKK